MNAQEMLARTLPRMKGESSGLTFIDALNVGVDLTFERLHRHRSEIIQEPFDGQDADEDIVDLPANYRGIAGRLTLVDSAGKEHRLKEYTPNETPTGERPQYFRLIGVRQMELLPAPTEQYTLKGRYYAHPGTLTMTSEIPWGGLFDNVLTEIVIMVSRLGSVEAMTGATRNSVDLMVDGLVSGRTVAPRRNKLW